jgi:pentatricopeptide repeat protein
MLCGLADAGMISGAKRLFEVMPERNAVSWNLMVVGLIRNGDLEEARIQFLGIL